ncbi:MAG: phosphoenolpyruvate--protein phosphotransferase [Deltaproteobacteria bacterium]|nr:phosphoenolpyruvate--protein phosphotransferase [Deltaproteobacteria bacterium]MBW2594648.1 phosphoenolpyruvate--protein phosphotransferase [Deltaproteobacteria bacterium]MBW2649502.1 phosphoenolpyruvate--protein phosphotransferase [Deltaproteobacteria bacterium]
MKTTIALKGIGVSPGIVIGSAYVLNRQDVKETLHKLSGGEPVSREIKRFRKSLRDSRQELLDIKTDLKDRKGIGSLFVDVHIMILDDKTFVRDIIKNIKDHCVNAEWALKMTISQQREIFDKIEDDYLRERIRDVEYVGQRILRNLSGKTHERVSDIEGEVVIVARDLSPADTVQMSTRKILGFATDIGGKTSHTAIVAKSIEIPAVVGLERITGDVNTGDAIIVDGTAGVVIINPEPEVIKRYEDKKRHYLAMEEDMLKNAHLPAVTADGHSVGVGANIEFVEEIPSAVFHGANGVGLYRTEFIYINRERLPTEGEHFSSYKKVIEGEGIKWATIRTFDLGGDKFVSDAGLAEEMNPVMGLRAIRFCLQEIDLFKVQLRAILRASAYGNTGILLPMISGVKEIMDARNIIDEVKEELLSEGIPIDEDIKIGIMIEVPSAVIMAEQLAAAADFFSIGTNDLIQYALAIDRVNERVTYLYEPLHPAILRMIRQVVDAGHNAGIKVAMCGEMAGDPLCTPILLGLELDGLSMTPLAIPRVKKIIRNSTVRESKELLKKVMTISTAQEIEECVRDYMIQRFPECCPVDWQTT